MYDEQNLNHTEYVVNIDKKKSNNKEKMISPKNNEIYISNKTNNGNYNDKKIINTTRINEKTDTYNNKFNIVHDNREKYQTVNSNVKNQQPTFSLSNNELTSKSNNNLNSLHHNNNNNKKNINENLKNTNTNIVYNKNNMNINANVNNLDNKKIMPLSTKNENSKPKIFQNIQVNMKGSTPKNNTNNLTSNKKEVNKFK